ncbi:hypothetical protein [Enterococcus gallinarum]|uniref:hypothetical protein n=1 Tax=Enterococcus gallinarum TaxID=1353 RepID=UPI0027E028DE|nr:hypothetical protein [Enterococcus gallinarum]MDQ6112992.1 hypothetical protein [Enterococcus gallinarum]
MKSLYIKEYDDKGNLIFVVDKKTGRGFRLKQTLPLSEVDSLMENIGEQSQHNLSESMINKFFSFKNEISPVLLSRILIILYGSFLGCLVFSSIFMGPIFTKTIIIYTKEGLIHSFIGLVIFVIGVLFIHEFSHIIAARWQGIYVKKVGFRIRYFIFPVFFVRIFPTSNRQKKMNIAFVGLAADLFLLNIYNTAFLISNMTSFRMALTYQLVMTIYNYNILLPTDFSNSLLQFINRGNFRSEAFEYSKWLIRKESSADNFYQSIGRKKKILYLTYTLLFSILWVSLVIGIIIQFIKSSQMG